MSSVISDAGTSRSAPTIKLARVKFRLFSKDARQILSLREAMLPETNLTGRCTLKMGEGSHARGRTGNQILSLSFESSDLVSLRASLNTNLRLVSTGLRTIDAVSKRSYSPAYPRALE